MALRLTKQNNKNKINKKIKRRKRKLKEGLSKITFSQSAKANKSLTLLHKTPAHPASRPLMFFLSSSFSCSFIFRSFALGMVVRRAAGARHAMAAPGARRTAGPRPWPPPPPRRVQNSEQPKNKNNKHNSRAPEMMAGLIKAAVGMAMAGMAGGAPPGTRAVLDLEVPNTPERTKKRKKKK